MQITGWYLEAWVSDILTLALYCFTLPNFIKFVYAMFFHLLLHLGRWFYIINVLLGPDLLIPVSPVLAQLWASAQLRYCHPVLSGIHPFILPSVNKGTNLNDFSYHFHILPVDPLGEYLQTIFSFSKYHFPSWFYRPNFNFTCIPMGNSVGNISVVLYDRINFAW